VELASLDADLKKKFNVDSTLEGIVIVGVEKNSDAAEKGLKRGDVITAINQEPVKDLPKAFSSLEKAKEMNRKSVLLFVTRGDDSRFVALTVK